MNPCSCLDEKGNHHCDYPETCLCRCQDCLHALDTMVSPRREATLAIVADLRVWHTLAVEAKDTYGSQIFWYLLRRYERGEHLRE